MITSNEYDESLLKVKIMRSEIEKLANSIRPRSYLIVVKFDDEYRKEYKRYFTENEKRVFIDSLEGARHGNASPYAIWAE
jgi:hypothetical protein